MKLKLILDFDGVMFNSAYEAFSVCNLQAASDPTLRTDVNFDEFMECRAYVTDAWQYHLLYGKTRAIKDFSRIPEIQAQPDDWAFSEKFFETRAQMMHEADWPKVMSPYDFFFLVRPLLHAHRDRFAILSTRNVASIKRTMEFFDSDVVEIFGQEDIRKHGSKIEVAKSQGWLIEGEHFTVYVDDMNTHLEPFEGKVHLPLHAAWGYDLSKDDSLSPQQIVRILNSLLKLAGN
jgi:hypothetical protein